MFGGLRRRRGGVDERDERARRWNEGAERGEAREGREKGRAGEHLERFMSAWGGRGRSVVARTAYAGRGRSGRPSDSDLIGERLHWHEHLQAPRVIRARGTEEGETGAISPLPFFAKQGAQRSAVVGEESPRPHATVSARGSVRGWNRERHGEICGSRSVRT